MKNIDNRIKNGNRAAELRGILLIKFIGVLLPWIATVVTALPFSSKRSRFFDRLVDFCEN